MPLYWAPQTREFSRISRQMVACETTSCEYFSSSLPNLGMQRPETFLFSSFDMAGECLGQHSGSDQGANLGDGNGVRECFSLYAGFQLGYILSGMDWIVMK